MPGGDGTGPVGMGPMTGRAEGAGVGQGFRGGHGRRNMFHATGLPRWMRGGSGGVMPSAPVPEQELSALKQQAEYFGKALEDFRDRIQELEAKPADK